MAIEKTTHLYEVLIRFGAEGYRGSHVIDLERVADGETVYAETPGVARPVSAAEVGHLLGAECARLIEQLDLEMARADKAEGLVEALRAELEALRAAAFPQVPSQVRRGGGVMPLSLP